MISKSCLKKERLFSSRRCFTIIRDHQRLSIGWTDSPVPLTALYSFWFYCGSSPRAHSPHSSPKIWQRIHCLCNISTPVFPCGHRNKNVFLPRPRVIFSKLNAEKIIFKESLICGSCQWQDLQIQCDNLSLCPADLNPRQGSRKHCRPSAQASDWWDICLWTQQSPHQGSCDGSTS